MMRHVFYAGQHYGSYTFEEWKSTVMNLPDGAYVRYSESSDWYIHRHCSFTILTSDDLPPELKTLCLLLDIPL